MTLADYRRDFIAPDKCRNLAEFLERPPRQIALMQTEQQIRLVVLESSLSSSVTVSSTPSSALLPFFTLLEGSLPSKLW